MKRISFEVAKAIKEAGYPQNESIYYTSDGELFDWNEIEEWHDKYYSKISAPFVMDVWLWLFREKKIAIDVISDIYYKVMALYGKEIKDSVIADDPEDAIIEAIEYLVEHDLIK